MSPASPTIEQPNQAAGQAASLERTVTLMGWGTPPADPPPTGVASPAAVQQSLPEALAQRELEMEVEIKTPIDMAVSLTSIPCLAWTQHACKHSHRSTLESVWDDPSNYPQA